MADIPVGHEAESRETVLPRHTAHEVGNPGVHVVSTPHLIGFLEMACHFGVEDFLDDGESTVGTMVNVEHLGAAPVGAELLAKTRVVEAKHARIVFAVEAWWGDTLLMKGSHGRARIDLERFLARLPVAGA